MWIFGIVVSLVVLLFALAIVLTLLGRRLPETHVASASVRLNKPASEVWRVIADAPGHARWAAGVTAVEPAGSTSENPAWRQRMGHNSFVLETTRSEEPRLLERTIMDDRGPFTGRWQYRIEPAPGGAGCEVTLTEHGTIKSPMPRAIMRYCIGEQHYIRKHLASLARHLGQPDAAVK